MIQFTRLPTMADFGFRPTGFRSLGQAGIDVSVGPQQPAPSPSPAPQPAQQTVFLQPAPFFAYPVTPAPVPVPPVVVEEPPPAPAVDQRTLLIAGAVVLGVVALVALS